MTDNALGDRSDPPAADPAGRIPERGPETVVLSADLMTASRVLGHLRNQGRSCGQLLPARLSPTALAGCRLLCIDLATVSIDWSAALPTEDRPRVVAFGPHVQEAALKAAAERGADTVLTRGQFLTNLERWLAIP